MATDVKEVNEGEEIASCAVHIKVRHCVDYENSMQYELFDGLRLKKS
ncbi:MAG: hypothetical protein QXK93_02410 [Candidatus Bathyarchaeia archaeon]|nr:hypothetical protein [Candidatus Bathyarchaeota archaeon]